MRGGPARPSFDVPILQARLIVRSAHNRIGACFVFAVGGAITACAAVIGIGDPSLDTEEGGTLAAEASPQPTVDASTVKDAAPQDTGSRTDGASPVVPCTETNAQQLGGHCYFVLPNASTQAAVKAACAAVGAHLVSITSEAEQTFITSKFTGARRWIGLQAPSSTTTKADFTWVTGEPATYQHWYSTYEPDGDGPCITLYSTNAEWIDRPCGESWPAICERE